MTTVISISTMFLHFSGIIFSLIYLWLNVFSKLPDLPARNGNILKIIKTTIISSMIFAFLSCLLAKNAQIEKSIALTSSLYAVIAISWLVILLACGVSLIYSSISKKPYRTDVGQAVKNIFKLAMPGAIIGLILSWLFS